MPAADAARHLFRLAVELRRSVSALVDEPASLAGWIESVEARAERDWLGEAEAAATPIRALATDPEVGHAVGHAVGRALADVMNSFSQLARFAPGWVVVPDADHPEGERVAPDPATDARLAILRAEARGRFARLMMLTADPTPIDVSSGVIPPELTVDATRMSLTIAGQQVPYTDTDRMAVKVLKATWPPDPTAAYDAAALARRCKARTGDPGGWAKTNVSRANGLLNAVVLNFDLSTRGVGRPGTDGPSVVWKARVGQI
jgi:hypothetical protein